jgi:hypothetical protein
MILKNRYYLCSVGCGRNTAERDRANRGGGRRFWRGCEAVSAFHDLFRLMLVIAQRETEVGKMRSPEVEFGSATWTIAVERGKHSKAHKAGLSDLAVEILEARERGPGFIFPSVRLNGVNAGARRR